MRRVTPFARHWSLLALFTAAILVTGCESSNPTPATPPSTSADGTDANEDGRVDGVTPANPPPDQQDDGPAPPPTETPPTRPATADASIDGLIKQLADKQSRDAARDALIAKGPAAVGELVKQLDNDDEFVRAAAAFALGQIGDKTALPALENRAAVEKTDVGQAALKFAIAALNEVKESK